MPIHANTIWFPRSSTISTIALNKYLTYIVSYYFFSYLHHYIDGPHVSRTEWLPLCLVFSSLHSISGHSFPSRVSKQPKFYDNSCRLTKLTQKAVVNHWVRWMLWVITMVESNLNLQSFEEATEDNVSMKTKLHNVRKEMVILQFREYLVRCLLLCTPFERIKPGLKWNLVNHQLKGKEGAGCSVRRRCTGHHERERNNQREKHVWRQQRKQSSLS